jgi:peptidoglycan/LPS O-acetylase OafA/YrhL
MAAVAEPAPAASPARSRSRFPHFPALDGLKGLAVLAIVVYDLGTRWAKGGHLGADTLFVLMGFLAMASLLTSRAGDHGVELKSFWTRRVRRIVGPTLVVLALAALFGVIAANAVQRDHLAGDGLSTLVSLTNWRMIQTHQAFGPATAFASPVRQFWLLAIVGQVVLVVSLLTALVLDRLKWSRDRLGALLAFLVLVSSALCVVLHGSPVRVLYGTDTRAAELLVGCVLAIVIYDPRITIRLAMPGPVRDTINAAGVVAGLFLLVAWVALRPNKLVIMIGLLAVALASAAVVLACIVPEGPVASLLALPPARALGRIAIALYLLHWPIYVWIAPQHIHHLHGIKLMGVRLFVTFVAAIALQFAYERVRDRERARSSSNPRQVLAVGLIGVVLVAGALVAVTATGPKVGATKVETTAPTTTTAPAAAPPTVAFYGDALASTLETAAKSWAAQTGKIEVVDGVASPACGIDRDQLVKNAAGAAVAIPSECNTWDSQWASAVTKTKPDIAVVVTGISEVGDHRNLGEPNFIGMGNTDYQFQLYLLMHKAAETLAASGTKVIWLNLPNFVPNSGQVSDPARVVAFNKLLTDLAGKDAHVRVEDLRSWIAANGGPGAEPSGSGFGPSAADHVITDFLGPKLTALWLATTSGSTTTTSTTAGSGAVGTVTIPPPPAGVVVSGGTGTSQHTHTGGKKSGAGTTRSTRAPGSTRTTQGV